jgi:hypothetical protein
MVEDHLPQELRLSHLMNMGTASRRTTQDRSLREEIALRADVVEVSGVYPGKGFEDTATSLNHIAAFFHDLRDNCKAGFHGLSTMLIKFVRLGLCDLSVPLT